MTASPRTALRDAYVLACKIRLAPNKATLTQLRSLEQMLSEAHRRGVSPRAAWARVFAQAVNAFEVARLPVIVAELAPTVPLSVDLGDERQVLEWLTTSARCGSFRPSLVAASLEAIIDRARFLRQQKGSADVPALSA